MHGSLGFLAQYASITSRQNLVGKELGVRLRPIARRSVALQHVRMKFAWIALIPFAVLFVGVLDAGCGCHTDCDGTSGVQGVVFLPTGSADAGDAGEQ